MNGARILTVTVEVGPCTIYDAATQALELAKTLNCNVAFEVNGIRLTAYVGSSTVEKLLGVYDRIWDAQNQTPK